MSHLYLHENAFYVSDLHVIFVGDKCGAIIKERSYQTAIVIRHILRYVDHKTMYLRNICKTLMGQKIMHHSLFLGV